MNVLIVEDEPIPAEYLKTIIQELNGFSVVAIVDNYEDALSVIKATHIDIICMDIMIKGSVSGAELALQVHDFQNDIIIIFLTAYSEKEMVEYAVEAEAFAYLLKPYRVEEIQATLQLAQKKIARSGLRADKSMIHLIESYFFDQQRQKLLYQKEEVVVSHNELKLLQLLAKNHPNSTSKETLLQNLEITDESLRALLYRLRKRTHKELIQSIKGFGYKLNAI